MENIATSYNADKLDQALLASKPYRSNNAKPALPLTGITKALEYNNKIQAYEIHENGYCYQMNFSLMNSLKKFLAIHQDKFVFDWFDGLDGSDKQEVVRLKVK